MAAVASLSDLVNLLTGGGSGAPEPIWFHKQARVAGAAAPATIIGRPTSLWTYDGQPAAGVAPTTVAVPDNTTDGGLKQTDPGGSREKWLHACLCTGLNGGTLMLYDRLLHIGGLSGTSTSAQTVAGTLTRNTGGVGNFAMAEIYGQVGSTGTTATISYTDEAGNAGAVSPSIVFGGTNFREQTRALLFPLASGDKGIQAVASVTLAASTTTAGNFGITIARPLAIFDIPVGGGPGGRTFAQGLPGLPKIDVDACLAWLWFPTSTAAPEIAGGLSLLEK